MAKGVAPGVATRTGVPNRNKQALLKRLEAAYPNWHPVVQLADIANDPDADAQMRFQAAKEVAAYVTPKLKAIEHSGPNGGPLEMGVTLADTDLGNRLRAFANTVREAGPEQPPTE